MNDCKERIILICGYFWVKIQSFLSKLYYCIHPNVLKCTGKGVFWFCFAFYLFFWFCCVAHVGLEHEAVLLPQPPECNSSETIYLKPFQSFSYPYIHLIFLIIMVLITSSNYFICLLCLPYIIVRCTYSIGHQHLSQSPSCCWYFCKCWLNEGFQRQCSYLLHSAAGISFFFSLIDNSTFLKNIF